MIDRDKMNDETSCESTYEIVNVNIRFLHGHCQAHLSPHPLGMNSKNGSVRAMLNVELDVQTATG